jgi:hypothetical protein
LALLVVAVVVEAEAGGVLLADSSCDHDKDDGGRQGPWVQQQDSISLEETSQGVESSERDRTMMMAESDPPPTTTSRWSW